MENNNNSKNSKGLYSTNHFFYELLYQFQNISSIWRLVFTPDFGVKMRHLTAYESNIHYGSIVQVCNELKK